MILQSLAGCIGTLLRKTRHRPPPLINALAQTRHSTTWTFIIEQEGGGAKFHVQHTLFEKVLGNRARGAIKIVDFKEI